MVFYIKQCDGIVQNYVIDTVVRQSYEIIRLAGNSDHCLVNFLSKPGLLIQNMTTKEPDDSMIEVAIRAVEAVFDWRAYENETFGTQYGEDAEQRKHAEQQENTDAADPKEDEV